jgi:DNA excision repair protein ERCC-4
VGKNKKLSQLQDYLSIGSEALLKRMFNKCLAEKHGFLPVSSTNSEPASVKEEPKELKDKGKGKKSTIIPTDQQQQQQQKPTETFQIVESPITVVQSMQIGSFALSRIISELKPRYVIMYDSEIGTVRQLEVFQAENPDFKIKVYFMMFGKSVEEQAYLSTLRREKEAMTQWVKSLVKVPKFKGKNRKKWKKWGKKLKKNWGKKLGKKIKFFFMKNKKNI